MKKNTVIAEETKTTTKTNSTVTNNKAKSTPAAKIEVITPDAKTETTSVQVKTETPAPQAKGPVAPNNRYRTRPTKRHHADFSKGEVPTKKDDVDYKYIQAYCLQSKETAQWFMAQMKKLGMDNGKIKKGFFMSLRTAFCTEYFPVLMEKKPNKANQEFQDYLSKIQALANS